MAGLPEDALAGLRGLLDALHAQGFDQAPPEAREAIVHGFMDAGPEPLAGISAFKGLTMLLFYGIADPATGRNPNWPAIGYPGPVSPPPDTPKTIRVARPESDTLSLDADVCVVGSGAGGGVIAGTLAQAGKSVVVLELGGYFNEADFNQLELWGLQNLYRAGGPTATEDGSLVLLAGANLGGGTTINWTNCLRTRPSVRAEWAGEHGSRASTAPTTTATSTPSGSASASTTAARITTGPTSCWRRPASSSATTGGASPATPTRPPMTRAAPASWAGATSRDRSRERSRPTSRTPTRRARASWSTAAPTGSSASAGARAGSRAHTAAPTGGVARAGQRTAGGGRRRSARDTRAAAALAARRARGRSLSAPAPSHRRRRALRRGHRAVVGRAADRAVRPVRRARRRLRLPDRDGMDGSGHRLGRGAVALGATPQGADERDGPLGAVRAARARPRPRPRLDRPRRQRGPRLPPRGRARPAPLPAGPRDARAPAPHRGRRRDLQLPPQARGLAPRRGPR